MNCPQVQQKSQLQALIQKLESQQLQSATTPTQEQPSAVANFSASDAEVRKAQAHLKELQERHALQVRFACARAVARLYTLLTDVCIGCLHSQLR